MSPQNHDVRAMGKTGLSLREVKFSTALHKHFYSCFKCFNFPSLKIMLREQPKMRCLCQLANYDWMRSSSASPSYCQGRRHATPWLSVMKRQRHNASCQDVLLHSCKSQTHITAHIPSCVKVLNPWASKDANAVSQTTRFNSRTTQYMRRPIMAILVQPYGDLFVCFFL